MRVLGIDCGTEYTGFGIVELAETGHLHCLTCGAIKLSPREPMPARLQRIYLRLEELIREHQPDQVAIEDVFYALNVKSALKLGQVRGVAMLAAAVAGLEVAEYAPLSIKSAVVGYGKAGKEQVQSMVTRLLALAEPPQSADASDALHCDLPPAYGRHLATPGRLPVRGPRRSLSFRSRRARTVRRCPRFASVLWTRTWAQKHPWRSAPVRLPDSRKRLSPRGNQKLRLGFGWTRCSVNTPVGWSPAQVSVQRTDANLGHPAGG